MKKHKITVIRGAAKLLTGKRVQVGKRHVTTAAKGVVLATGSRVKGLPQIGLELDKATVISSDEALFLEKGPCITRHRWRRCGRL
jgi:dihydrolipoamide dehydrogenase